MNYSELTLRHFECVANAGELNGADVFRGAAGSRNQGTWIQFDLQVRHGSISAARFLAFACPHTIAVAEWLTQEAVGTVLQKKLPVSVQALRDRFDLPVEKTGRLLVVEDAWTAAALLAIDYRG
jgi:NifU-like protein involved in Fe-S cluster formation